MEKSDHSWGGVGVQAIVPGVPWGYYTCGCTRWQDLSAAVKHAVGMVFALDTEQVESIFPQRCQKRVQKISI